VTLGHLYGSFSRLDSVAVRDSAWLQWLLLPDTARLRLRSIADSRIRRGVPWRACLLVSVAVLFGPSAVAAQEVAPSEQPSPAQCVERALNAAGSAGAVPTGAPMVEFLLEKETRVHSYTLVSDGCVGFLAIGQGMVKDLDLAIHADTGMLLAQDTAQDSHPYARYCGATGLSLHVVLQMYEGRGEVTLVTLLNAPHEMRALADVLRGCGVPAPDTKALTDVGPEPPGPSLPDAYLAMAGVLAEQGYRPEHVLIDDTLSERRRVNREAQLKSGVCYALALIGEASVEDLDLRVVSRGAQPTVLGEDSSRERFAVIKVCPPDADVMLDIRMYRGEGRFQVHSFVSEPVEGFAAPAGVEGGTRSAFAEISHAMARRGMQSSAAHWAVVEPGSQTMLPVRLLAGRCYAIGAVVGPELDGADLDLRLVDTEGRLLAWELGSSDQPLVFHCSAVDRLVRVVGEAHGIRGAGRFLVIVARELGSVGDKS